MMATHLNVFRGLISSINFTLHNYEQTWVRPWVRVTRADH